MARTMKRAIRLACAVLLPSWAAAETHHVRTAAEFMALPALKAGDHVVVHDGKYADVEKDITGEGTAEQPIVVRAETMGGVAFAGQTYVGILGSHVTFAGFRFDGETAEGGPRRKGGTLRLGQGSRRCRVTNCMIRGFNKSPLVDTQWLVVEGFENVVEYSSFEGKTSAGPTVVFTMSEGVATQSVPRGHVFRFNYMGPRTNVGANGYEGIRVGLSGLQEYNAASTFEHNYFFRTIYPEDDNGEQEVVSNKSSGNTYRGNTFRQMKGELSLRHGDDCVVEGNYFFQEGTPRSAGVRVIGERHVVRGNYFEGVAGTGILVYSGDRDWPASETSRGHEAGDDAKVVGNTFVHCRTAIAVAGPSDKRRAPERVEVRNNIIQSQGPDAVAFRLDSDRQHLSLSGNLVFHPEMKAVDIPGIVRAPAPLLAREADGGPFRRVKGVAAGAAEPDPASSPRLPITRSDVGPSYYEGPAGTFVAPR
jgi:poly(beta-D-mannuronate) lyase